MRSGVADAIRGGERIEFERRSPIGLAWNDEATGGQGTGGLHKTEGIAPSISVIACEIGGVQRLEKRVSQHLLVESD